MNPGKRRYQIFLKSDGAIDVYLISKDDIETEIISDSNSVVNSTGPQPLQPPEMPLTLPPSNSPFLPLLSQPPTLSSEEGRMLDYYLSTYPSEYISELYLS
jgi:hypothetical protein